ncbi:hypothetical protein EON66_03960 [archaeon]|nr:MAG: hypothetical protein EON66_03960 [archaeon]
MRAASLVCQVYFLNSGLKVFDAMEMIPPYQSSIVIVGVMFGWIYYKYVAVSQPHMHVIGLALRACVRAHNSVRASVRLFRCSEGENVPTKNLILFAVGCGISIGGICVLLLKKRAKRAASELSQGTEAEGRRASTADVMLAKLGEEVPLLSHPFGPSLSARSTSKETPLLPLHAGSDSTLAKPPVVAASAGESTLAPERSDSSDMLLDDRVADLEAMPGQTVLTGDALERRMSTAGLAMVDAMVTAVHVVSSRLHSRSTSTDDAAHQRGSTERSDSHGVPSVAWQSYQNEHL